MLLLLLLLLLLSCIVTTISGAPIPYPGFFERKNILPPFLRDPLVSLIGETCYVSLVEDFNIADVNCLKYAFSKALGFGIVFGSAIIKVPQMITIMTKRSAIGLSLTSYYLETYAYIIILAYNLRQNNPFSTYGEVVFIASQNVLITLMIIWYSRRQRQQLTTTTNNNNTMDYNIIWSLLINFICFSGSFLILLLPSIIPMWLLVGLYALTIPIILASKIPQILTNHQNKSTGQLSVFAVINYFAGTTARVFTTLTELDDPLMLAGNILASLLNGVLVLQVYLYWGKSMDHIRYHHTNNTNNNSNNNNISMDQINNNNTSIIIEKSESKAD